MPGVSLRTGAFNLLWQLLATELPDDDDVKEQQKDDKEEQEEEEEEVKEGEGEGQERVPTIREMYFAPVFQVIIWCTKPPKHSAHPPFTLCRARACPELHSTLC